MGDLLQCSVGSRVPNRKRVVASPATSSGDRRGAGFGTRLHLFLWGNRPLRRNSFEPGGAGILNEDDLDLMRKPSMTTTTLSGTMRSGADLAVKAASKPACVRRSGGLVSGQGLNRPYRPDLGLSAAASVPALEWHQADRRFEIAGFSQEDGRMR